MRFLIIFIASLLFASITQKINKNKKMIFFMNKKLDLLATQIKQKEKNIKILNSKIEILNNQIKKLKSILKNSNEVLLKLEKRKKKYEEEKNSIQKEITNFLSDNYFNSINTPENINDLITKEVTNKLLDEYSYKIAKLIEKNKKIKTKIHKINQEILYIIKKQKELANKKNILSNLIFKQKKALFSLKKEKQFYKNKLKELIENQKALQEKLKKLQIIKNKKITSHKKYYIPKTIPPIKGEVTKKFGSYIDPIYHIKIENPSITITPYRPNAVVRAIMDGRVVYIGESHSKKVIIIKHRNNMFSIYANLDKVSPLLKKGSIVKKGQIIARVNHSLEFEITYKDKPINPLKVINLR